MPEVLELAKHKRGAHCCEGDAVCSDMTPEDAQSLSDDLGILAHPVRLQILDILAHHTGQVCVCDLESALPVKQPTVSHHLKLLYNIRNGIWIR